MALRTSTAIPGIVCQVLRIAERSFIEEPHSESVAKKIWFQQKRLSGLAVKRLKGGGMRVCRFFTGSRSRLLVALGVGILVVAATPRHGRSDLHKRLRPVRTAVMSACLPSKPPENLRQWNHRRVLYLNTSATGAAMRQVAIISRALCIPGNPPSNA